MEKKGAHRRLAVVLGMTLAAGAQAQPGGTTPLDPGPFAVGRADWHFGPLPVSDPAGGSGTIATDLFGTLRYPGVTAGEAVPVAPGGPFPFVLYAPGRFHAFPYINHNHEEADYLLDHLASWGFVVAAVNLDGVGMFASPPAIEQRGEILLAALDGFAALDPGGLVLDWQHLGLVGHSRGAEGCLSAIAQSARHQFGAVALLATTHFTSLQADGLPSLSLYGSKDGDVNNAWPVIVYEQANGAVKAFEYLEGGNHFYFTDDITYALEGAADITREQQHDVAKAFVGAFLRAALRGETELMAELADGPLMAAATEQVVVHPMYSDPDALRVDVYDGEPLDPSINTLHGLVAWSLLSFYWEGSLHWPNQSLYHPTVGAWLDYATGGVATPLYVQSLGLGLDVTPYTSFSLRAIAQLGDPKNPVGKAQDLRVGLLDGQGRFAVRKLGAHGTIPYPITHPAGVFLHKSVLRTTRIPLSAFQAANPALDLSDLRYVGLVFDQTPSAALRLDDLEFTR